MGGIAVCIAAGSRYAMQRAKEMEEEHCCHCRQAQARAPPPAIAADNPPPQPVSHAPAAGITGVEGIGSATANVVGDVCGNQSKTFKSCVKSHVNDIHKCQLYFDMLSKCQKN